MSAIIIQHSPDRRCQFLLLKGLHKDVGKGFRIFQAGAVKVVQSHMIRMVFRHFGETMRIDFLNLLY
jgi:hypothetical protein